MDGREDAGMSKTKITGITLRVGDDPAEVTTSEWQAGGEYHAVVHAGSALSLHLTYTSAEAVEALGRALLDVAERKRAFAPPPPLPATVIPLHERGPR